MARTSLVGSRIAELRLLTGLSCRALSEIAGLQPSHVRAIEQKDEEKDRVSAKTVARLAEVFGVSIDWLYTGVGVRPSDRAIRKRVAPLVAALEEKRAQDRVARRNGTGTSG